ncbi:MAG: glycerophosphodiester phosphodiesterase [Deltaproteobacteria bacterium]|nr:glycerophosphodiester phosphodiesterase [Deltaproteobacteria bacterium]
MRNWGIYKKWAGTLLILVSILMGGQMGCVMKGEEMKPTWKTKFPVMVIAHRGFSGEAPENTLAAFQKAIEVGSDMLELDVHLSKDKEVVVIHDETLERTTNGQGRVADLTLKELKKLDAGFRFAPQFSGERIPALKEILELARGRLPVNIEIKNPSHSQYSITELTDRALLEVKKAGMLPEVIFSSFDPVALERIKEREPGARVALLCHRDWILLQEVTLGKPYSVLNLRRNFLTREKIAKIHQEGMKVNVYTVDSEEEMEQFIGWGIDGIITNQPDRLIKILQKKFS